MVGMRIEVEDIKMYVFFPAHAGEMKEKRKST